ncbi:carbamoyltransferase N-terminal domain-containing protein [Streptomyces violaceochromogenes]|uniref:Carbamoyltransferase N-terminal domain-containing protein n=1 Tax=Streptomyces violaceochromogenes TaxID=67377 RepID=A0ABU6LMS5_9ACTN|nr:carbamoyltransferase N-terminal domain-containing protein [Streptomyces violaceochromogenes]MEC7050815.1 carbamoyltransferase N-terminal domain-containing protein [Streptomyces violaceochromogenes]GHC84910.1 nodulation protein [Streptomyces violaceochromogenes]
MARSGSGTGPDGPVLGISAYYHDSAAAVVAGGVPLAAAQEERFTRRRHDAGFPAHAVTSCLREAGLRLDDLAAVAFYEDPALKFRRVLATWLATAPRGYPVFRRAWPEWTGWKRRAVDDVRARLGELARGRPLPPVVAHRHHASHAASAFFPSPFSSAAVLCVDGVGEWETTTLWHGRDTELVPLAQLSFPHSLGMLYSAFTYYCGFKVDSGEYKLMGLAPYGTPRYAPLIRERLIDVKPDGSFRLELGYFTFQYGLTMVGRAFEELFGGPRRTPEGPLTQREFDLAASVQQVTEEVLRRLARTVLERTGERRLCLAGGVALNCVANGRILTDGVCDELWVQPAAGDAGGALGAALAESHHRGAPRAHAGSGRDAMAGALLGPACSDREIEDFLADGGYPAVRMPERALTERVAAELAAGRVVGWCQGRMEFGPRALGNRSILADPRDPVMQSALNLKTKFRESFRPFAPAVLAEEAKDWFELPQESPYMLLTAQVAAARRQECGLPARGASGLELLRVPRSTIPAVTHVDGSARVQTVTAEHNPRFHALLTAFRERTGCPVLVNTSFNVRGEPIVRDAREAYACFMRTRIDLLVLGDFLLNKRDQPEWREEGDWRATIPMD